MYQSCWFRFGCALLTLLLMLPVAHSQAVEQQVNGDAGATPPIPQTIDSPTTLLPPAARALNPNMMSFGMPGRGGMDGGLDAGMPSGLGGGMGGAPGYSASWYPARPVNNQNTNLSLFREDLRFGAPLYKDETDTVMLTANVGNTVFSTNASFPATGHAFPDMLWNISLGTLYLHHFDNEMTGGMMVSLGSSSDRPFDQSRDYNFTVGAFLRVPQGERNAWNFTLFYSPLGEIAFPIPGVSYFYNPSDNFQMNIGLPFSIMYRPYDDLTFDISYMILTNLRAQVAYRLTDAWKLYLRFQATNTSWFLSDSTDDRERLFSYEKDIKAGVRYRITDNFNIDLGVGYAFDRYFFIGTKSTDSSNRIDVGNDVFISLQASFRW